MSRLLVVEDDPDVAAALSSVLEDEGHEVRIAENGQVGLDAIAQSRPDAVLLDVEMPVLDGPGMADRLLVLDCGDDQIPVVLLSGSAELSTIARAIGTKYFLTKPYDIETLAALVRRAVSEHCPPFPEPQGTP